MRQLAAARQAVHAELERKLLEGVRPFPNRHSELGGLEIDEIGRECVRVKVGGGLLFIEVGCAR